MSRPCPGLVECARHLRRRPAPSSREGPRHRVKKLLAGTVGTVLALGGLGVATATLAAAATPYVQPSCNSLYISLEDYPEGTSVVVTLDGETVDSTTFDTSYSFWRDFDFSTPHDWSVDVDAPDGAEGDL